ncbi:MAG: NAD(P)-dependent oxidoreductase [Halobacteriales archaeon]
MHLGLIGVGFIGKLFVDAVAETEHRLTAYDVDPDQTAYAVEGGAEAAEDPAAVGGAVDTVVMALPGAPESRSVVYEEGLLDALSAGDTVIDATTTGPDAATEHAEACAGRDVRFLTAPLTRGAADPGIHMMVGGTEADYGAATPVLDVLSAAHARIGSPADAQTFKLMIQLKYAAQAAVDAEVVAFGEDNGLDPELMNEFLGLGVDERYFTGEFSQAIEGLGGLRIWHKDTGYALDLASETGTATPLSNAVHEAYKAAVRRGGGGHAASIVRYWRRLNG